MYCVPVTTEKYRSLSLSLSLIRNVKDEGLELGPPHKKCFASLKSNACKSPILKPIDYDRAKQIGEYIFLICDASISGIGSYYGQGTEWQTCRPAGFLSKKFSSAQQSYRTYEWEMLAIREGLLRWEDMLLGRKIVIITDHHTLEVFNTQ